MTPATAERAIVGRRNDMTRALTAAFERVEANTSTVSAYSAIFPPTCVAAWTNHRRPNAGSRRIETDRIDVSRADVVTP
jgi:hypothetical protein